MSDPLAAAQNLGLKALRRLGTAHKPIVRALRRRERGQEQLGFEREARAIDRQIAAVAAGDGPIIAGPWLAEVGYEALYWVPFLRWFQDAYRVVPERLTVVSRGGVAEWYRGIAGSYVELFDLLSPADLAARNAARMVAEEAGGRKQSGAGALDAEILDSVWSRVRSVATVGNRSVLHPSLMFRLFRHVWHGNLPFDFFWTRTRYTTMQAPPLPPLPPLPAEFVAVKFYAGAALPESAEHRRTVRDLVAHLAARTAVVTLETGLTVDEHEDYTCVGVPNVISAREWMRPSDNLGVQTAIIGRARLFLGTCGGLAWLAPFLGVPTVAVYADDRHLAQHLFVARQAGRRAGATDFLPLDLRAIQHLGVVHVL